MIASTRSVLTGIAAAVLLHGVAAAKVWVVDPPSGYDNGELQAALDAATNGDVVLVRPAAYWFSYQPTIAGKGITVVRDGDGPIWLNFLRVESVPAGENVVVRGFQFNDTNYLHKPAVSVAQCAGGVFLEDCVLIGQSDIPIVSHTPQPALAVEASGQVTLLRCELYGGCGASASAVSASGSAAAAAALTDSTVLFQHCSMTGGLGGSGPPDPNFAVDGGNGLCLTRSTGHLIDCEVAGGGNGSDNGSNDAAGDGASLDRSSVLVVVRLRSRRDRGRSPAFQGWRSKLLRGRRC